MAALRPSGLGSSQACTAWKPVITGTTQLRTLPSMSEMASMREPWAWFQAKLSMKPLPDSASLIALSRMAGCHTMACVGVIANACR
ncbi:hypothetical protein D3C71_1788380 [compost metagenome]